MGTISSQRAEDLRRYLLLGFQRGKSVRALTKARPKLFEAFEAATLAAGEETGRLEVALRLLASHYTREYRRMLKVRSFLSYPLFFGIAACFVLTLPFLKRSGMRTYLYAISFSLLALLFAGGIFISLVASVFANSPRNTLARFARTLALGAEVGLPRARFARLAADASGNRDLRKHIEKRSERHLNVMPLGAMWEGCRAVPADLLSQMKVADATGDYANTLTRYADQLDARP
jgi:type II secretory pathway component PulF